jgi:hypothetical protein
VKLLVGLNISEKVFISLPFPYYKFQNPLQNLPIKITETRNEKTLQIADLVSWSVFKKYEHNESLYFDLLKENIEVVEINESDLF